MASVPCKVGPGFFHFDGLEAQCRICNPPKPPEPEEEWRALRDEFLKRIEEIDKRTPGNGSMIEPDWWLEMMEARSLVWRLKVRAK
jgi:hypothetical protein